MNSFLKHFLTASLLLAAAGAQAQVPEDYQATVKVTDQNPTAREKALREALSGVLVKVSGQPGLTATGRTAPILARASALIRSVAYETNEKNELQLVAVFEPNSVDTALRQAGLPVHGVMGASVEEVVLSISGIDSTQDYARALTALRQPGVKNLRVVAAQGDAIQVTLRAEGGPARLAGALSVNSNLRRVASTQSDVLSFTLKR